jgi:hypothetical protein
MILREKGERGERGKRGERGERIIKSFHPLGVEYQLTTNN